jgi:very-short-patch-repair endonuclease
VRLATLPKRHSGPSLYPLAQVRSLSAAGTAFSARTCRPFLPGEGYYRAVWPRASLLPQHGHSGPVIHSKAAGPLGQSRFGQHGAVAQPEEAPNRTAGRRASQCGVLSVAEAVTSIGHAAVRWRIQSGRWQRPCRGVVVTHSGPLSSEQLLWVVVLGAGTGAALAGLTAARLDGLIGFDDGRIHVVVPSSRVIRAELPDRVVAHRSRSFGPADVHPVRRPPRTRTPRSILDAASWMRTENGTRAVLAAGVQQRLVRADDLAAGLAQRSTMPRQALMRSTVADIASGAQALSELDFCRLTRRYRLPEPSRQVLRRDASGRARWLDVYWERARLVVEVDGLWHMDAAAWWADMRRDNDLTGSGYRLLRFPAFTVRDHPEVVAMQVARALRLGDPSWQAPWARAR